MNRVAAAAARAAPDLEVTFMYASKTGFYQRCIDHRPRDFPTDRPAPRESYVGVSLWLRGRQIYFIGTGFRAISATYWMYWTSEWRLCGQILRRTIAF